MEPLVVREFREGDEAQVLTCVAARQDYELGIDARLRPGESMAGEHLTAIRKRCRAFHGSLLVAELDGEIAGFATILTRVPFELLDEPPGTYALVADLVVREALRGRGIGAELLTAAERFARAAGAAELRVAVPSRDRTAALLYRSAGFVAQEETLSKRLDVPARRDEPVGVPVGALVGALVGAASPDRGAPIGVVSRLWSLVARPRRHAESYYEPRRHEFTTACIVLSGVAGAFYAGATRWELMSDPNADFATGFGKYQLAVALGALLFAIGGGLVGSLLGWGWERWHRRRRASRNVSP